MFKVSIAVRAECSGKWQAWNLLGREQPSLRDAIGAAIADFEGQVPDLIDLGVLLVEQVVVQFKFEPPMPRETVRRAWGEAITDLSQIVSISTPKTSPGVCGEVG